MTSFSRTLVAAASVLAVFGAAACGSGDPLSEDGGDGGGDGGGGELVIGSADFAENELLAEIYAEALRTTGASVSTKPRIGAREAYVGSVRTGEISLVPDYTGNLLYFLDEQATATTAEDVNAALGEAVTAPLEVLTPSPAEDKDVLVVTQETADSGLRSMDDLGSRCGDLVLGAASEWKTRWEAKIKELYGCTFKDIRSLEAGAVTVDALTSDQVQVANLFTTASAIDENNLVELDDPKHMYPAQNVVPLINADKFNDEQRAVVDKVSAALDTETLTELVRRVEVDKENAADVAKEYVGGLGL